LGLRTIQIGHDIEPENKADFGCMNLKEASSLIAKTNTLAQNQLL
jgi:hypothetical protein